MFGGENQTSLVSCQTEGCGGSCMVRARLVACGRTSEAVLLQAGVAQHGAV